VNDDPRRHRLRAGFDMAKAARIFGLFPLGRQREKTEYPERAHDTSNRV